MKTPEATFVLIALTTLYRIENGKRVFVATNFKNTSKARAYITKLGFKNFKLTEEVK